MRRYVICVNIYLILHKRLPSCVAASTTCFMSLFCALFLAYMDKRAARILKRKIAQEGQVVRLTDIKDFPAIFWLVSIICIAYYMAIFPFIALGK